MRFVNDEARSFIARSDERADIIQISLIDTWAATASGAFVLTENSLYTVEAWRIFLEHLAPRGILSVSRWYYAERPGEVYRLATLRLDDAGADGRQPARAITSRSCARARRPRSTRRTASARFSSRAIRCRIAISTRSNRSPRGMQFEVVQSPRHSADQTFADIASADRLGAAIASHPLNIAAPTDDRPFFFYMLRLRDVFNTARWRDQGIVQFNMAAVGVLGVLFVTVIVLTALCIGLPLVLSGSRRGSGRRRAAPALFCRDRVRLHARRNLAGAAAGDLPRTSRLQPLGRAVFAAPVERGGQRVDRPSARRAGGIAVRGRPDGFCSSSSWWRSARSRLPPCGGSRRHRRRYGFCVSVAHPVAARVLHGHGLSDRHAAGAAGAAVTGALVVGRQRRGVRVRVGGRRRDRDRRGDFGGILGRRRVLRRRAGGVGVDGPRDHGFGGGSERSCRKRQSPSRGSKAAP